MKTEEELQRYYNSTLLPELGVLEEKRKQVAGKLFIAGALIFGVIGGTGLFLFFLPQDKDLRILYGAGFICIAVWGLVYHYLIRDYAREFKGKVIEKIIHFIDENLKYEKDLFIPESAFMSSRIFRRASDRYRGDDYVSGKIGTTDIKFSEIHAEYKTETRDSKGRRQTQWHTIFKGLFFIADFNKNFKGETVVLPDTAERLFGHVGTMLQSWNTSRGELIKLEDPEFEKLFVVYGDDQIEARYILSTSLMKRMTEFKKKIKNQVHFSFVGSKIFAAISYQKSLFEPRVFKTVMDFKPIQEYFEDLELAVGMVDDLNLNRRIWGK